MHHCPKILEAVRESTYRTRWIHRLTCAFAVLIFHEGTVSHGVAGLLLYLLSFCCLNDGYDDDDDDDDDSKTIYNKNKNKQKIEQNNNNNNK